MNIAIARPCAALLLASAAMVAQADIVGQSTSTSGTLEYVGMGDVGGGVGSGRYTLGTCVYASPNTTCTLSGTYAESAQSSHAPGTGGTFTLQLVYPGNGPSPVVARSISPGSDILQFANVGGINLTHQGTTIFGTWFTYDVNGKPLWYSVTATQTGAGTFSGTLYRTTGPAFNAVPFDPHAVVATPVGTATLTFTDGNTGTFAYAVNDGANVATQTKQITRQVFRPPGTVCHAPSI